jgi:hypothetical protein
MNLFQICQRKIDKTAPAVKNNSRKLPRKNSAVKDINGGLAVIIC